MVDYDISGTGQGTMAYGFPKVYNHDGSEHDASDYIDHEDNNQHDLLMHVAGAGDNLPNPFIPPTKGKPKPIKPSKPTPLPPNQY